MNSTIILSDLHLGDNFHNKRLQAFLDNIALYDRVILNGDFLDDFWEYEETVISKWSPLFSLLKTKEVIYLFGNHDRDTESLRESTKDFINEYADTYVLPVADKELVIMHGHTIYPRPDGVLYETKITKRGKLFQRMVKILWQIGYPLVLAFRFFIERYPKTLAKIQRPIIKYQNERMKVYAKKNLESHQILVCGHSHFPEFAPEKMFINEGANSYERIEYLSIIDEKIQLVIKKI